MLKASNTKLNWLSKLALPLTAVALIVASGAMQKAMSEQAAQKELSGQAAYTQFCAACHGVTGKGDGPLSENLEPTPNDLTLIAKWNKGSFPYNEVYEIIDGRAGIRPHGTGQMPVWGERFAEDSLYAHETIRNLVMYLETLQAE